MLKTSKERHVFELLYTQSSPVLITITTCYSILILIFHIMKNKEQQIFCNRSQTIEQLLTVSFHTIFSRGLFLEDEVTRKTMMKTWYP